MLGKKLVTAQKRGETRALCLGLGMVACSMMMYFFTGITIIPAYKESVWTKETMCKLIKANIKDKVHCMFNDGPGDENVFQYPCLEVLVDLNLSGQEVILYHNEETKERNPKCSYIPQNLENYKDVKKLIENIAGNFREKQTFPCYYDPTGREPSVILERLYPQERRYFAYLWPSLMLLGGVLIIIMESTYRRGGLALPSFGRKIVRELENINNKSSTIYLADGGSVENKIHQLFHLAVNKQ